MNFKEQLEALKTRINGMITKDSSTEQVKAYGELKEEVEKLGQSHEELVKEHSELKDLYIQSVKNYGTSDKPVNEPNKGTTFEEIMSDMENESKKGK